MTAPEQPEEQQQQDDEDEQSLVPALLAIYALFLLWRGANSSFSGSVATVERALQLRTTIGPALAAVAQRALGEQRAAAGRSGDELWQHADQAVLVGVDAGLQTLAEALLWTDRHADATPADAGGAVPTRESPPGLLARMVAGTVVNAARMAAADLAGWRTKVWQTRQDNRVRDAHVALHGDRKPLGEPFVTAGHKLMFPHDPAAPIELRANCRCRLRFVR